MPISPLATLVDLLCRLWLVYFGHADGLQTSLGSIMILPCASNREVIAYDIILGDYRAINEAEAFFSFKDAQLHS